MGDSKRCGREEGEQGVGALRGAVAAPCGDVCMFLRRERVGLSDEGGAGGAGRAGGCVGGGGESCEEEAEDGI